MLEGKTRGWFGSLYHSAAASRRIATYRQGICCERRLGRIAFSQLGVVLYLKPTLRFTTFSPRPTLDMRSVREGLGGSGGRLAG